MYLPVLSLPLQRGLYRTTCTLCSRDRCTYLYYHYPCSVACTEVPALFVQGTGVLTCTITTLAAWLVQNYLHSLFRGQVYLPVLSLPLQRGSYRTTCTLCSGDRCTYLYYHCPCSVACTELPALFVQGTGIITCTITTLAMWLVQNYMHSLFKRHVYLPVLSLPLQRCLYRTTCTLCSRDRLSVR